MHGETELAILRQLRDKLDKSARDRDCPNRCEVCEVMWDTVARLDTAIIEVETIVERYNLNRR
jgi:hypothetical protein